MSFIKKIYHDWSKDRNLGTILRNSRFLFSSSSANFVFSLIQAFLAPIILGVENYGYLGIVTGFSGLINKIFSFRMNDLVIKSAGDAIGTGNTVRSGEVIKFSIVVESIASIIAFAALLLVAPFAPQVKVNPVVVQMIYVYSFALLANFAFETFNSVLRTLNKFDQIAKINFFQGLVTALLIVIGFFMKADLLFIVIAYLMGKVINGLATAFFGFRATNEALGNGWWKTPFMQIPEKRVLFNFAFSTNISQSMNLVFRDSEVVFVGYLTSASGAAYYKLALAMINLVMLPVNALNSTVFPEISKAILKQKWKDLKYILSRTTIIVFGWMSAVLLGVLLVGPIFFAWYNEGAFYETYNLLLILVGGYFIANLFFWNRDLLLSFNRPNIPLVVMGVVGTIKTVLLFTLVPSLGFRVQAILLGSYLALTVTIIAIIGIMFIQRAEKTDSKI